MVNGKTMISLASSLKCSGQSSAQPAKGGAADAPGAAQAFPAALAAAAPVQTGEADAEMAATLELAGNTAPGTALPISLRSGKTLPVLAAAATAAGVPASALAASAEEAGTNPVQDDLAQSEPAKAEDEASLVPVEAQPLAVVVQLALPEGAAPVPQTSGIPDRESSVATAPKGSLSRQNSLSAKATPEQPPAGQAPAPSVTVHAAAQAKAPAGDRPLRVAEAATGPGRAPRAAKEQAEADASLGAAPAKLEPQLPAPAVAPPNTAVDAVRHRAHDGAKAVSPIAAMHDLTSVVDRLVAAREALAPATAAITLQHGELGDLSLRFEQHRDGHLAVQLSASNPDAHRAIVAAVSDAGFRGAADSQAGTSQQSAQPQANARGGGSAEREPGSAGNGSAARHDQPQQRRAATQQQERSDADRRRAGIFA
jgi:hypothetical protein